MTYIKLGWVLAVTTLCFSNVVARQVPVGPPKSGAGDASSTRRSNNHSEPDDSWVQYQVEGYDFTASFPAQPSYGQTQLRNGQAMHIATLTTDAGMFMLVWTEIPSKFRGSGSDYKSLLEGFVGGMARSLQVTEADLVYTYDGDISNSDYPGGQLHATGTDFKGYITARTFETADTYYTICTVIRERNRSLELQSTVDRFLNSFALKARRS